MGTKSKIATTIKITSLLLIKPIYMGKEWKTSPRLSKLSEKISHLTCASGNFSLLCFQIYNIFHPPEVNSPGSSSCLSVGHSSPPQNKNATTTAGASVSLRVRISKLSEAVFTHTHTWQVGLARSADFRWLVVVVQPLPTLGQSLNKFSIWVVLWLLVPSDILSVWQLQPQPQVKLRPQQAN